MRPYAPDTDKGRTRSGDDIHHRTADQPRAAAKTTAKVARHGARRDGKVVVAAALAEEQRNA